MCTLHEVELAAPTKTSDRVCGCPTVSGFYRKGSGDEGTCTPCTTCADTEYVITWLGCVVHVRTRAPMHISRTCDAGTLLSD